MSGDNSLIQETPPSPPTFVVTSVLGMPDHVRFTKPNGEALTLDYSSMAMLDREVLEEFFLKKASSRTLKINKVI
jgi:hypothetical protein